MNTNDGSGYKQKKDLDIDLRKLNVTEYYI